MFAWALISLCLAALIGGSGLWTLRRPAGGDLTAQVVRLMAPTQLAAAVMLAAGGVVGLAAPGRVGLAGLGLAALGAVGTIAAGSWQGARYAARRRSPGCDSAGGCGGCTRVCGGETAG